MVEVVEVKSEPLLTGRLQYYKKFEQIYYARNILYSLAQVHVITG